MPIKKIYTSSKIFCSICLSTILAYISSITNCYAMNDLGTLGGQNSQATGISPDGLTIIGNADTITGESHGFACKLGTMTDLGTLGGNTSIAKSVSEFGASIVGSSLITGNTYLHAFMYTSLTGMVDLGTLGGNTSEAIAVSPDSSIIIGNSMLSNGEIHAFIMDTPQRVMTDLGTLGGNESKSKSLSYNGAIVIGNASTPSGDTHAFKYDILTGMIDLGTLGGTFSEATAISLYGSIIVGASTLSNGNLHAFKYDVLTEMTDLGTLGGIYSKAIAVSETGVTIIGTSTTANNEYHAFKYTDLTGMVDLGTLGGDISEAIGLSWDGGIIVGNSATSQNHIHGFIYTDLIGMYDIGSLGGDFSIITGISFDGKIIIGYSTTATGEVHAFMHKANVSSVQFFETPDSPILTTQGLLTAVPPNLLPQTDPSTPSDPSTPLDPSKKDLKVQITQLVDIDNTLLALNTDAQHLANFMASSQEEVIQALDSDCTNFGPYGICINAGGRYISTKNSEVTQKIGIVGLAYKFSPHIRVGVSLDQNISKYNSQYTIKKYMPLATLYGVWEQYTDEHGLKVRLAGIQKNSDTKITRTSLPYTEAGEGTASTKHLGLAAQVGYGFNLSKSWNIHPALGIKYTHITRGSYQESPSLNFPICYDRSKLNVMSVNGMLTLKGYLTKQLSVQLAGNVEQHVRQNYQGYAASIPYLGSFNKTCTLKKTTVSTSLGLAYAFTKDQTLSCKTSYGQSMFSKTNNFTTTISYSIGF